MPHRALFLLAMAACAGPVLAQPAPPDAKSGFRPPALVGRTTLFEPVAQPAPSFEAAYLRSDGTLALLVHEHETTADPSRVLMISLRSDGTQLAVRRLDVELRKEEIDITRAAGYVLRDDRTAAYLETRDKATRLVEISADGAVRMTAVPDAKPGYLLAATATGYLAVVGDRDDPFHQEGSKFFLASIGRDGRVAWRTPAPVAGRPLFRAWPRERGAFGLVWVQTARGAARNDLAVAMLQPDGRYGPPRLKRVGVEGAELLLDALLPFDPARGGFYLAGRMTGSGHAYCAWLDANGAIRRDNDRKPAAGRPRIECPGGSPVALGNGGVLGVDDDVEGGRQALLAVDRNGQRLWQMPPRPTNERIERLLLGADGMLWLLGLQLGEGGTVRALFAERFKVS